MTAQSIVDALTPPITLFLLVAVGLDLTLDDFRPVRRRPGMVAAGVLLPPLLLPLLAVGVIDLVQPSPLMAAGLLLLVVCPIGGLSTFYSAAAAASPALSVTLTATSCAAAVITIPLATWWLGILRGMPAPYGAVWSDLLTQLLLGLAPPVLLGMTVRQRWPAAADRHRGTVQAIGFALLFLLVALVAVSAAGRTDVGWWSALALVASFVALACVIGGGAAAAFGGGPGDRFTFSAEFATRNVAVALGVAQLAGRANDFIWFAGVYLAVEIPLLLGAAVAYRTLAPAARPRG